MTSILRPDELERESDIRKSQGRTKEIKSGIELGGSLATAGLFGSAASKVMPFLNKYIAPDLALKGINKVMPKLGEFLKNGMKQGLTLESGLNYIKDSFEQEESNSPVKQNRNIIQQHSPELHQFIDQQIKSGRAPIEAGALAQNDKRFKSAIDKITKQHKTPWSSIIESVYGQRAQKAQEPQAPQNAPQNQQGMNNSGGLDPAVQAILAQGEQILKGRIPGI